MTTPAPTPDSTALGDEPAEAGPKYGKGDMLAIPCHGGTYIAEVVHVYSSFEDAEDRYEKNFRSILQAPFKKPKPDQVFYYCEVNNSTKKALGVAEEHAKLKRAAKAPTVED